jgi:hypothetical protein
MCEKIKMKINIFDELNREDLFNLYKKYPNWFQLGNKVRNHFDDIRLTQLYPNDYTLGEKISKYFSNNFVD